jgi:uncharacterized protein
MSKIEVYKDKKGKWRFRIVARNGETVASSESYSSHPTALQAAEKAKIIAAEAKVVDTIKKKKKRSCKKCA